MLCMFMMLMGCESKRQLPELSAWQTCEYMMGVWFDGQMLEEQKVFYHLTFLEQIQKMPNFSKFQKKKKGVWQVEYHPHPHLEANQVSTQAQSSSSAICHYLYFAKEVPLLLKLDLQQVQLEGQSHRIWQITKLINETEQEGLIALLKDEGLLSISQNQIEHHGLNAIDRQYKPHSSVMVVWLKEMVLVDGISLDLQPFALNLEQIIQPEIESWLQTQIELAFQWREASAKQVQSRYQRKLLFAIDPSASSQYLPFFFKIAKMTQSQGISLAVKTPDHKLTSLHLSTPAIEGKANINLGEIDLTHSVIVNMQADQTIEFEYQPPKAKEIKKITISSDQGEIPMEILIQKIDDIRMQMANEMHQLGFLISFKHVKEMKKIIAFIEKLYSIDEGFFITVDLRGHSQ